MELDNLKAFCVAVESGSIPRQQKAIYLTTFLKCKDSGTGELL